MLLLYHAPLPIVGRVCHPPPVAVPPLSEHNKRPGFPGQAKPGLL